MNKPNTTLAAALLCGALSLGGCATTHIGDDWQCPLTQGSPCLSVAAADPATGVAQTSAAPMGVGAGTPQRAGAQHSLDAPPSPQANRSAGRRPAGRSSVYRPRENRPESGGTRTEGESVACNAWCRPFAWLWRRGGEDAAADETESDGEAAVDGDVEPAPAPAGAPVDLRTPEVIGRIWIAPYVDANGVYREASWVRVVLEPARWRLP